LSDSFFSPLVPAEFGGNPLRMVTPSAIAFAAAVKPFTPRND
jgi:hypothetical protein